MPSMDRRRFETLVARAIDDVPPPFAAALDEVAVVVESRAPAGDPDLYGLYEGVPLDEPWAAPGALPARIVVFMHPLIDDCSSDEEVVEEVRITVLHELGHHLGMGEEQLDDLGYG